MTPANLDSRSVRMLELLARGATSKEIAKELGYQDGTMRVYLHNLYRKLGVANKTAAVIWFMTRNGGAAESAAATPATAPERTSDIIGDMAMAEGLYATLGVWSSYVGPYSRVWEAGARAAGEDPADDAESHARSRLLWKALLTGDFTSGKASYDVDEGYSALAASAIEGVLLASLLIAGGFSHAARQLTSKLVDRRRSRPAISAREAGLLEAAFEAFEGKEALAGLARLQKLSEGSAPAAFRHLAMALLFNAARARRDPERARQAAHALWSEAESAARELKVGGAPASTPKSLGTKSREKAAA